MPTAWRIVKTRYAASAFDGEGGRRFGGRWNSPGVPVVYAASSRSLAVLEIAVHVDRSTLLGSFVLIPCHFDERFVTSVDRRSLPAAWRRNPAPAELAIVGDAWVVKARSAVLEVPSAIIQEESNFLLNPRHSDFSRIKIGKAEPFEIDQRLLKPR